MRGGARRIHHRRFATSPVTAVRICPPRLDPPRGARATDAPHHRSCSPSPITALPAAVLCGSRRRHRRSPVEVEPRLRAGSAPDSPSHGSGVQRRITTRTERRPDNPPPTCHHPSLLRLYPCRAGSTMPRLPPLDGGGGATASPSRRHRALSRLSHVRKNRIGMWLATGWGNNTCIYIC